MQETGSWKPRGLAHLPAILFAKRIEVTGWSMAPTLLPGERVLVNRRAYRKHTPARGDIVLADDPRNKGTLLLKRVAAIPGDHLEVGPDGLLVNGKSVSDLGGSEAGTSRRVWALGPNDYFLLGDAAKLRSELSTDSRTFGPVPRKLIHGHVWMVYWPASKARGVG